MRYEHTKEMMPVLLVPIDRSGSITWTLTLPSHFPSSHFQLSPQPVDQVQLFGLLELLNFSPARPFFFDLVAAQRQLRVKMTKPTVKS
jgi:hypothetical protein